MSSRSVGLALGVTVLTVALSTSAAGAGDVLLWTGQGKFPAHERYDWCGGASSSTVWSYEIEILEVDWGVVPHGYSSSGRIFITDGDQIKIDARVEAVKHDIDTPHTDWPRPILGARGSVYIDNRKRRFAFLWTKGHMWFGLAAKDTVLDEHIDGWWENNHVLPMNRRDCELHSVMPKAEISYPHRELVCSFPE